MRGRPGTKGCTLSNSIKASEPRNPRENPRKIGRPLTLQALRAKRKPTAWLRSLISPLDFGVKIGTTGPRMEPITKPVHCNTNAEIVGAFRDGDWSRIERLSNPMLDDHRDGRKTYYYTCNGSTRNRFALARPRDSAGGRRGRRASCGCFLPRPLPRAEHARGGPARLLHPRQGRPRSVPRQGDPEGSGASPGRLPPGPGVRHRAVRDQGPPAGRHVGRRRTDLELHGGHPGEDPPPGRSLRRVEAHDGPGPVPGQEADRQITIVDAAGELDAIRSRR